jgi:hypothetical protein
MSAFEYAMRPFLDTTTDDDDDEFRFRLPSPIEQGNSSVATSPLFQPLQDDEISYASDEEEEDEEIHEDGVPTHLKEKDSFRTTMRLIQLRTLLMQCTILLATVQELERKPWVVDRKRPHHWYYSKMRRLSYKAFSLAQLLESQDLQARCEYWLGRACGGTRDYQAAEEHFKLAVQLDVPNDRHKNGTTRLRGLRPAEKADVRFLLNSVCARQKEWVERDEQIKAEAERLSRGSRVPAQHYIDASTRYEPPWMPDRDRAVYLAKKSFGVPTQLRNKAPAAQDTSHSPNFDEAARLEAQVIARYAHEDQDMQDMTRRILTKQEWHYIHHGDAAVDQQKARKLSGDHAAGSHSVADDIVKSPGSELLSLHFPGQEEVSENALHSLQQELLGEESYYDEGDYENEGYSEDDENFEDETVAAESLISGDGVSKQGVPRLAGAASRDVGREDSLMTRRRVRLGPIDTGVEVGVEGERG